MGTPTRPPVNPTSSTSQSEPVKPVIRHRSLTRRDIPLAISKTLSHP
jgi:hypothetical protein